MIPSNIHMQAAGAKKEQDPCEGLKGRELDLCRARDGMGAMITAGSTCGVSMQLGPNIHGKKQSD